ncbi:putative pre-mRNA-splicing factor Cwf17p [[Candida] railenensis]|uniref:Pre-mRNA-splicing factor Cwf17p n=1 Tax=[Candida] railenensis TaxID=45579 RepID=A0A9P0W0X1_9ASCO|nr:putative pre-mRNA-splicing factor Cwf17p [[Candida] railenensis]
MSLVKKRRTENGVSTIGNQQDGKILSSTAVELVGHQGASLCAKFSNSDGNTVATSGQDGSILLWNLPVKGTSADEVNYGLISGHKSAVTSIRWFWDNSVIASSSADATVGFWDVETGQRIRKCVGHELCVNEVSISKQSDLVLSVSDDGWTCIWDKREKHATIEIETEYPLLTGTFNSEGSVFYTSGIEPIIKSYDIRYTSKPLWECNSSPVNESITSLAINNDDSLLLSRSFNGFINTYSAKEFVPENIPRANAYSYVGAPSGNEQQLIRACFSNDNVSIVSGSEDKTVTTWDLVSRKIQRKLDGHRNTVVSVDYHPEEKIIVSTSLDGAVIVREI